MLSDGYAARGTIHLTFKWDFPNAEKDLKRALELSPNSPLASDSYINYLWAKGRFEEGLRLLTKAVELDPFAAALYGDLGFTHIFAGQYTQAVSSMKRFLELDPGSEFPHMALGRALQAAGRNEEALAEFEAAVRMAPEWPIALAALGWASGLANRPANATKMLRRFEQLSSTRYVSRNQRALIYIGLKQYDTALDWLEKSCEEHEPEWYYLRFDPAFTPVHEHPRFQAILKKIGSSQ
jgi:tetratricopeptide (TPR) repeat protein